MSLAVLSGPIVTEFVQDREAFNHWVEELFARLDTDGDGVLSRAELLKGMEGLMMNAEPESPFSAAGKDDIEAVFDKFDGDGSGTVDREEFRAEMREIMLAVARGIGESPVHVALDSHSLLARAFEHGQERLDGEGM